jgi:lipid-A-disaccharide synthase
LKSIFVSAGEVSGDHYIARTVLSLRNKGFDGRIYGMCGAESRANGIETLWRNEVLHLMGISEVLKSIGPVLRLLKDMRRNILEASPDAVLVSDSPDFHLPLVKSIRHNGYKGKIFYISPPSVWAWRKYRVKSVARFVDVSFPLFAFEHDCLARSNCDSRWIGHPLVEEFTDIANVREDILRNIKGPDRPLSGDVIAALLPGSRRSEIESLYPVFSELYKLLENRGVTSVFSVAPGLSDKARNFLIKNLTEANQRYYEGPGGDIMNASDVVAGSSGTATAEALLLRRYMVVMYKVKPLSAIIGRILLRGVRFAIPNILAGTYFYPELLQERASALNAYEEICGWLDMDEHARLEKMKVMDELVSKMGRPGVYGFWADEILEGLG